MIPRILTGVALTGMLAAAGCGGGSGAGSPALSAAPAIGGSVPGIGGAAPSAKARGSFVASFNIPWSAARASAASSRSPQYLSPGTTGLAILIGNGGTSNVTTGAGTAETATLGVSIAPFLAGAGTASVTLTPGSFSVAPVSGQTLTIAGVTGAAPTFTISSVAASGTALTGAWSGSATAAGTLPVGAIVTLNGATTTFAQTAVIGSTTAALALQPGTTAKSIPLSVNGATATSSVTYSFAPATTAGYFTFSAAFNNFAAGTAETIGVVTTDISHNNFVLAEGQTSVTVPANGGQAVPTALTLKPVVANVFVATPTIITSTTGSTITNGIALGSLETTVFATDEMGYVIPTIVTGGAVVAPENTPTITITPATAGSLTFNKLTYAAGTGTPAALTATSLTSLPATATLTAAAAVAGSVVIKDTGGDYALTTLTQGVTGTLLQNILTPAPFSLTTNGAVVNPSGTVTGFATNSAGNPVNITCAGTSSSVAWNAVITSAVTSPTTVAGYSYSAGTNYPAATGATIPLTPINCSPGFTVPIN
jgi:hypothetical protein